MKFLRLVSQGRLDWAAADEQYLNRYREVMSAFDAYMHPEPDSTWYARHHARSADRCIAYFSAEFGLHESLPIYSGGLGILSGDHCKTASDLGLPFVAVGFLYPQGYFQQRIDADGRQQAIYEKLDFAEVPGAAGRERKGRADPDPCRPARTHGIRQGVAHPGGPRADLPDGHRCGAERAGRS